MTQDDTMGKNDMESRCQEWEVQWKNFFTAEQVCLTGILTRMAEGGGFRWKEFRALVETVVQATTSENILRIWMGCTPEMASGEWVWWYGLWLEKAHMVVKEAADRDNGTLRTDPLLAVIAVMLEKTSRWAGDVAGDGPAVPSGLTVRMEDLWNRLWERMAQGMEGESANRASGGVGQTGVERILSHLDEMCPGRLPVPLAVLRRLVAACRLEEGDGLPPELWRWSGHNPEEQREIQKLWIEKAQRCPPVVREYLWRALLTRYRGSPTMVELAADTVRQTTSWSLLDIIAEWKPAEDVDACPLREAWEKKLRSPDLRVLSCAWKGWRGTGGNLSWDETASLVGQEIGCAVVRGAATRLLFWSQAGGEVARQCPGGEKSGRQWLVNVWQSWQQHPDPDIQSIVWLTLVENGIESHREGFLEEGLLALIRSEPLPAQVVNRLEIWCGNCLERVPDILVAWQQRERWDVNCREGKRRRLAAVIDRFVLCPAKATAGSGLQEADLAGIEDLLGAALTEDPETLVARTRDILKQHWQKCLADWRSGTEPDLQPDRGGALETEARRQGPARWWGMLMRLGDDMEMLDSLVRWAEVKGSPLWAMELVNCLEIWEPEQGWPVLWAKYPEKMELLWASLATCPGMNPGISLCHPDLSSDGWPDGWKEQRGASGAWPRLVTVMCRLDSGGGRFWRWMESIIRRVDQHGAGNAAENVTVTG